MEYVEGVSLLDKICEQENKAFSEKQAAEYMLRLFSAVNHCHANGVIHRDIKPDNIMVTHNNELKLIDFGLSTIRKEEKFHNEIVGTGYYMAPEVIDGRYTETADIWSLGALLYLLVSGYLPFQGKTSTAVFAKIKT